MKIDLLAVKQIIKEELHRLDEGPYSYFTATRIYPETGKISVEGKVRQMTGLATVDFGHVFSLSEISVNDCVNLSRLFDQLAEEMNVPGSSPVGTGNTLLDT